MRYIVLSLQIIYKIYYFIFFSLSLTILFPFFYFLLSDSRRFPKAFILMRLHAFSLLLFAGVFMKIKGISNIPKNGAYIICPNHSSFFDTFCLYSIFSRYFVFIGKKEIEKWPLFHIFYTSGMNILVDRQNPVKSINALRKMCTEIDKGHPLAIFPEGTISKEAPKLGPFKSGAFAIAIQKQVPILPVTFVTNYKLLERGGIWKGRARPGIAEIIIHKPINTVGLNKKSINKLQMDVMAIIDAPLLVS
ncbi:MAG: 1-acyl-sn-glycerol-3-phosphate acyltransferase [Bacteroidia bacterium]|nr:1-acyl-sn-glycerol-3-phosphate acyltransferase [Bacteroidia bacterium]